MQGVHARVIHAEHSFYLVVHALPQRHPHGQAVVGQRFHSCRGHRLAVGQRHALSKAAPHRVGQRCVERNNILLFDVVGRGEQVVRQCAVVGQQHKAGARLVQPPGREQLPPGEVRRHQIDHRRILLVAAGADDALGLIEHDVDVFPVRACQRYTVQRHGGGVLVQLGVRLAADCAVNHHASLRHGLAALAASHSGALGQVLVQPHHASCSWVMAAVLPRVTLIRSAGEHSICVPMRPPETSIVSWARQLSSNTVTNCFFMPTGLQPPRM